MLYTVPLLLSLSALISASPVDPSDFSGTGYISIIASNNVSTATPAQKIGCLDTYGKVIVDNGSCGVFTKLAVYPNTLSTSAGNCTFRDNSQEKNTDSLYGKQDDAWSCGGGETGEVGDAMYTVVCFIIPFPTLPPYPLPYFFCHSDSPLFSLPSLVPSTAPYAAV